MPLQHEFIPDTKSPAYGKSTFALKIAAQDKDNKGRKELVKYRRAREWGLHEAIEPGFVSGLPGVRALRLWTGRGPNYECLPVSEAKEKGELTSVFLASASESGRLIVSSCVGYDRSRQVALPEKLWNTLNDDPISDDALIYDFKVVTKPGDLASVVPKHLVRAERHGVDPLVEADPNDVDLPFANLLKRLPESSY